MSDKSNYFNTTSNRTEELRPPSSRIGTRRRGVATSFHPGLSIGATSYESTKLRPTLKSLNNVSPLFSAHDAAAAESSSPQSRESSIDTSISSPSVQAALSVNVDRITNENLRGVAVRLRDRDYKPKLYELCLAIRALGELIAEVNSDKGLIDQRKSYLHNRLSFITPIFEKYPLFERELTADDEPILKENVQQLVSTIFSPEYETKFIPVAINTLPDRITGANPPINPFEYAKQWWRYILQDIVVNDEVISNPDYAKIMGKDVNYAELEAQLADTKLRGFIQVRFGNYPVQDINPHNLPSFKTGTPEAEHLQLIQDLTTIRKSVSEVSKHISDILKQNTEFNRLSNRTQQEIVTEIVTEGDEIFTNETKKNEKKLDDALEGIDPVPGPFTASSGKAGPEYGGRRKKTQRCLRKHPHVKSMKPKKRVHRRKTKLAYKKRETKKR
jgi:hypothetical protein